MSPAKKRKPEPVTAGAMWLLREWTERAPHIYPHDTKRARTFIRAHRKELEAARAIVRPGSKDLLLVGDNYLKWLLTRNAKASEFKNNLSRGK